MSYPFGITGIGYNPYMSGLGMLGLSGGGTYSSYYNPAFMGYGGMGMMGMYPAYMQQMNQTYQNMEKSQLNHAGAMHELLLQNKTNAFIAEDRALFEKTMEDRGLQTSIVNLAEKIREGDSDGVCEEYDKIKATIYQKYNSYFKENTNLDPAESVRKVIEDMYAAIISKKSGETVSLRNDIKRFGETAFMHGFNEKFFGKKDYHNKYTEETINYVFGTRIDNKGGKDRMEKIGGGAARVAEGVTSAAAGYGIGIGLAALGKVLNPFGICKKLGLSGTHKLGKWAAVAALGADVIWQLTRD